MPQLATFYGIVIYMYNKPREHNPPHIHASYAEHNATIVIKNGKIIDGNCLLGLCDWSVSGSKFTVTNLPKCGKAGKLERSSRLTN